MRQIGIQSDGRSRHAGQNRVENGGGTFAAKGKYAGGHLIQDGTQGEQVTAGVEFLRTGLLRRNVGDGVQGRAGTSEVLMIRACRLRDLARGADSLHFGQSEIGNFGMATTGNEDVGGFDVAVHDAFAMCGIERVSDVDRDTEKRFRFDRTAGDAVRDIPWR